MLEETLPLDSELEFEELEELELEESEELESEELSDEDCSLLSSFGCSIVTVTLPLTMPFLPSIVLLEPEIGESSAPSCNEHVGI